VIHLQLIELFRQIVAALACELGGSLDLSFLFLDFLGHAIEGVEGAGVIGQVAHRLLNALLCLGALLAGDEEVFLALGLFDFAVEQAQRALQLVGGVLLKLPLLLELGAQIGMFALAREGLFGEVVATGADGHHGLLFPLLGQVRLVPTARQQRPSDRAISSVRVTALAQER
jgi:hypothetical protein